MDKVRAKRIAAELQGRTVGGWKVGSYIGNGASALVVDAERGGQTAALKIIDPEFVERYGKEQQLARVERERALIGHSHPNLVKIFDGNYCPETEHLYVAMDLLALPQLTALVPQFPTERIGPIIRQLASAAQFLESLGLAHRDIKPDNVVISRDCQNAVLLDLGVVRPIADPARADAGSGDAFLGTTRYSPPEYLMREEEDSEQGWRAVTFYQLGAILHDLIMRRSLFGEISSPPARLIDAVRHARPAIDAGDAPSHLVSLARNCLQKNWRLRVELVKWEHFTEVPPAIHGGEAKDRIRRRIALSSTTAAAAGVDRSGPTPAKVLEDMASKIAGTIREICIQSGTFPPLEVRRLAAGMEHQICVRTGPSAQHALEATLEIRVAVALLDDDGLVVRLNGLSAIGTIPQEVAATAWTTIYAGDASSLSVRDRLDDFLHLALDAAQNAGNANEGTVLALPPLG